jgi:RES domain-containing protein
MKFFSEELSRVEATLPSGTTLYRARLGFAAKDNSDQPVPYSGEELGPPPRKKAQAARANRKGEIVLYVCDQEATAVAEVRPARGLLVSIGRLHTTKPVRIVDLSKISSVNPFTSDSVRYELELCELLHCFADDLSTPIRANDNPLQYLPSQRISRFVRDSGYEGIRFPSAVATCGTNLVLFDTTAAQVESSWLVTVDTMETTYSPYDPRDESGIRIWQLVVADRSRLAQIQRWAVRCRRRLGRLLRRLRRHREPRYPPFP